MNTVFLLRYIHILPGGEESMLMIGVYSSAEAAQAAVERLKVQPGFRDHPHLINPDTEGEESGFSLGPYVLDRDYWEEGFITV